MVVVLVQTFPAADSAMLAGTIEQGTDARMDLCAQLVSPVAIQEHAFPVQMRRLAWLEWKTFQAHERQKIQMMVYWQ